ncbi:MULTISPECIES: hypothetical protein [unclassified Cupriavidus]|uniref:hypothetical protein n=1 Tax=unclassified Cupriavidus TaxID=2640874 RepID=UPI00313DFA32
MTKITLVTGARGFGAMAAHALAAAGDIGYASMRALAGPNASAADAQSSSPVSASQTWFTFPR